MSFTNYYFQLGYDLEKKANIFTDEEGNLTTGSKVGLGALGLGAAGLAGYGLSEYMQPDAIAEAKNLATGAGLTDVNDLVSSELPEGISAGVVPSTMGFLSRAKDHIIDSAKGAKAMARDTFMGNPHATPEMWDNSVQNIKAAVLRNRQNAKDVFNSSHLGRNAGKIMNIMENK